MPQWNGPQGYDTDVEEKMPSTRPPRTMRQQSGVPQANSPVWTRQTSASRHTVAASAGIHPDDMPYTTDESKDDRLYDTRLPSSALRYQQTMQHATPRTLMRVTRHEGTRPPIQRASRFQAQTQQHTPIPWMHWLFRVGMGVLLLIVVVTIGGVLFTLLGTWWQTYQDDQHYGRPRTFQTDQAIGHGDSIAHPSHFIAFNLHGHTQVIELPEGDATKMKVYLGPILTPSHELDPVTVSFEDINGDGKLDMILTVDNLRIAFINENGLFRPLHPDEHVNM